MSVAEAVEAKGATAPYIVEAVREKLARDQEREMSDGFALLAGSPEMWDMDMPTGGQRAAVALFDRAESALEA